MNETGVEPDAIRGYILNLDGYSGASGVTSFLPNGDVDKPIALWTIEDGKAKRLEAR